jgi:hypothetical protein
MNAGSGNGILRLAPENSAALWREGIKTVCFELSILKQALKWTHSVYLRAF